MKIHPTVVPILVASFTLAATGNAIAADAHQHAAGEPTKLVLDHGKKWPTDEPLRKGMTEIREALAAKLWEGILPLKVIESQTPA